MDRPYRIFIWYTHPDTGEVSKRYAGHITFNRKKEHGKFKDNIRTCFQAYRVEDAVPLSAEEAMSACLFRREHFNNENVEIERVSV